ncbi:histidine kinase [Dawidia soli]|uniref:Histidine kinase n=1 Tax=Dawidia soli TaxID=2782352 RepID=A0AAP2GKS1_9BACT|nr:histidine kinase [Dawidia soli]MBT1690756.1 histidine kinase [Dawidia soli]
MHLFLYFLPRCLPALVVLGALLLPLSAKGQSPSTIETMAMEGYAQRFTDTVASLNMQQMALTLARQQNSVEDKSICYAYLALTHRRLLHLKDFTRYADSSYLEAGKTNSPRANAYSAMAMGALKSYIEDNARALDYLLDAYRLFASLKAYDLCARIGADISYLFASASPSRAKKYADEALSYAMQTGDPESILHARLAVGSYLLDEAEPDDQEQWSEAVDFYRHTVLLAERDAAYIVSKSNIGVAYVNLAVLYMNGPKPIDEEAFLFNLEKTIEIARQYNLKNIYRSSIGLRGQYFMQKGEYTIAEELFQEGIAYQRSLPYEDNAILATFYEYLKDIAARRGDYWSYYRYDQSFVEHNKLKYDESTQRTLQYADARFESERQTSLIHQLEEDNKLQRKNQLLGYGIAIVLLIGLVFMYRSYYYRQRYYQNREDILKQQQSNNELRMQLLEKETLESLAEKLSLERRLLSSQMDPHFIFNALGNIQSMMLQKDTAQAVSYLGKFAKLTRQVLEQSRTGAISLAAEMETLNNYLSLQQLRLNDSFHYRMVCDAGTETGIRIPPLLIQPFVENAVEHGLKPLPPAQPGLLEIRFREDAGEKLLTCTITDNGIGLAESKRRKAHDAHRSLSTRITDERLSLMMKNNPRAGFAVHEGTPDGPGCTVILHIPIVDEDV